MIFLVAELMKLFEASPIIDNCCRISGQSPIQEYLDIPAVYGRILIEIFRLISGKSKYCVEEYPRWYVV